MIEKDAGGSRLVENPDESKWIKHIFSRYAYGNPLSSIKLDLEDNEVSTRRGNVNWSLGSLQKIIRNSNYIGIDGYLDTKSGINITNKIPQLISHKLFLDANRIRQKHLERKGLLNRSTKFYLLRDFLVCGGCDTPMGGRIREQKNERLYYCPLPERRFNSSRKVGSSCNMKKSLNIPSTDKEVWDVVTKILTNSKAIKDKIEEENILGVGLNTNQFKSYISKKKNYISTTKSNISQIEELIVQVETSNLMGEYPSPEVYNGIKSNLTMKHTNLSANLELAEGELTKLNNKEDWLFWIDECAKVVESVSSKSFKSTIGSGINEVSNLSAKKKKRLLHNVLDKIEGNYNHTEQLHHLKIRFRLPVMSDVTSIFKSEQQKPNIVGNRIISAKSHSQCGNQTTPVGDYSTVMEFC